MPQGVYIENPDDGTKRVKPLADGSINVNTGTVTIGQPVTVTGSVGVSNTPAVTVSGQPIAVSFSNATVNETPPAAADIRTGAATATGTLITVPAGRVFRGSVALSASISVAGNCSPNITSANTGGGSGATAGTLHQVTVTGLALSVAAVANTLTDIYIYGGTNGATITFTQGASGQSTGPIAGRLL